MAITPNRHLMTALLFIVVAVFLVFTAPHSTAQVTIEERQRAELPSALMSSSKSKIVLTSNNQLDGRTTANVMSGQSLSGQYFISSDTDRTIRINVTDNNVDSDISLTHFTVVYKGRLYTTFPVTGLPSPGKGESVYIGFTATVKPRAGAGERNLSYDIDVTEEN